MAFCSYFFNKEQNALQEYVYFPTELFEKDVTKLDEITLNSLEKVLSKQTLPPPFKFKVDGNPDYIGFIWNYFYDVRVYKLDGR